MTGGNRIGAPVTGNDPRPGAALGSARLSLDKKMSDWREDYERAAEAESARLARASDRVLLEAIRARQTGEYYTIWRVIGERRPKPEICWTLYETLTSDRDYLDRYHCAQALLRLLGLRTFEAAELSALSPNLPGNLAAPHQIIEAQVGAPKL